MTRWLGSRVVSVLDLGAEGPGFESQSRRCRVTVLGKLFAPIVPLFTKQRIGSGVAGVTAGLADFSSLCKFCAYLVHVTC